MTNDDNDNNDDDVHTTIKYINVKRKLPKGPFQNPPILNSCAFLFKISSLKTQADTATNEYNTNPRLIEILNSFTVFTDPSVCPY